MTIPRPLLREIMAEFEAPGYTVAGDVLLAADQCNGSAAGAQQRCARE